MEQLFLAKFSSVAINCDAGQALYIARRGGESYREKWCEEEDWNSGGELFWLGTSSIQIYSKRTTVVVDSSWLHSVVKCTSMLEVRLELV